MYITKMQLPLDSIRFQYVMMLLVGLVLADGVITEYLVGSGLSWEGNPLLRNPLESGTLMPLKLGGALISTLLLASIYRTNRKMAMVASWLFIILYTCIVYWNIGGVLLSLNH
jgi:hypothetical protein